MRKVNNPSTQVVIIVTIVTNFSVPHYYKISSTFSGLDMELYYVTEGKVNNFALNFSVPVPPKVDTLHFTWESLSGKPVSKKWKDLHLNIF